jgi:hypothetical protein
MRRLSSRWLAWWYLTIALGFLLLAARYALLGEKWWFVGLRVIIAGGFALLSYAEFHNDRRK